METIELRVAWKVRCCLAPTLHRSRNLLFVDGLVSTCLSCMFGCRRRQQRLIRKKSPILLVSRAAGCFVLVLRGLLLLAGLLQVYPFGRSAGNDGYKDSQCVLETGSCCLCHF